MTTQQFCLRWNNHRSNLLTVFDELLQNGAFTDVTIAADCGRTIKCHKIVLAACSSYFQTLFMDLRDRNGTHPIVVLKDVEFLEIKAILEYMYRGEVNVAQDHLSGLLKLAEMLKVKGLAENADSSKEENRSAQDLRHEEIPIELRERSPPPTISTNTSNVPSSTHIAASPPHSSTGSYGMYNSTDVENHLASMSMWSSSMQQRLSLSGQSSTHSSILGTSYDSYETSPHNRRKLLQSSLLMSHDKESILRKVLDVNHPDSSQGVPLLQSDSHETIYYRGVCSNGPTNGNNRRSSMELTQGEIVHSPPTDEDEKPQSIGKTKSDITNHPPVSSKPEWKRYKQYTQQDISSAIEAVRNGMSAVQAARKFHVPSRTLYDKVKKLGVQTSRPLKRPLATNGASTTWYGGASNANGGIYNVQPKVENENVNVAETMVNTSAATATSLEVTYSNIMVQDRDSMSDTTTRSDQSPVIRCAKLKQEQQSVDDEVEDLSVSRKSDVPMTVQSLTASSDAVRSERADSEPDNSDYY